MSRAAPVTRVTAGEHGADDGEAVGGDAALVEAVGEQGVDVRARDRRSVGARLRTTRRRRRCRGRCAHEGEGSAGHAEQDEAGEDSAGRGRGSARGSAGAGAGGGAGGGDWLVAGTCLRGQVRGVWSSSRRGSWRPGGRRRARGRGGRGWRRRRDRGSRAVRSRARHSCSGVAGAGVKASRRALTLSRRARARLSWLARVSGRRASTSA
jgi:hypothetical protein